MGERPLVINANALWPDLHSFGVFMAATLGLSCGLLADAWLAPGGLAVGPYGGDRALPERIAVDIVPCIRRADRLGTCCVAQLARVATHHSTGCWNRGGCCGPLDSGSRLSRYQLCLT